MILSGALDYYGTSEYMSSYTLGSRQHYGQPGGDEGDEEIVQAGGEGRDVQGEVHGRVV